MSTIENRWEEKWAAKRWMLLPGRPVKFGLGTAAPSPERGRPSVAPSPAGPVFAGIDQESWALFAERERRWLFDTVEWLLKQSLRTESKPPSAPATWPSPSTWL
jgi:hypothetical protein